MFCDHCGGDIPVDAKFCRKCGSEIAEIVTKSGPRGMADSPSTSGTKKRVSNDLFAKIVKRPRLLLGVTLILALIIDVSLAMHARNPLSESTAGEFLVTPLDLPGAVELSAPLAIDVARDSLRNCGVLDVVDDAQNSGVTWQSTNLSDKADGGSYLFSQKIFAVADEPQLAHYTAQIQRTVTNSDCNVNSSLSGGVGVRFSVEQPKKPNAEFGVGLKGTTARFTFEMCAGSQNCLSRSGELVFAYRDTVAIAALYWSADAGNPDSQELHSLLTRVLSKLQG